MNLFTHHARRLQRDADVLGAAILIVLGSALLVLAILLDGATK